LKSHHSVSVVRTTFKVYGKRQTLTLSQPKTPEPIVTKFECYLNECTFLCLYYTLRPICCFTVRILGSLA